LRIQYLIDQQSNDIASHFFINCDIEMTLHGPCYMQSIPREIFDHIITLLFLELGIYRAVALRLVNRAFDAAIIDAICVRRVIDVQHESTPRLLEKMGPALRAKIFLQPSRSSDSDISIYMSVTASTNEALDALIGAEDERAKQQRHQLVAENVCVPHWTYITDLEDATFNMELDHMRSHRRHREDGVFETVWVEQPNLENPKLRARNLLSAAALCGSLPVVDALLKAEDPAAIAEAGLLWTPFFHHPLTLAAAAGHLEVVQSLLSHGYRLVRDTETAFKADQLKFHFSINCAGSRCDSLFPPPSPWRNGEQVQWDEIRAAGRHPLSAAVLNGHADIVSLFLKDEHRLPRDDTMYLKAILAGAITGRLHLVESLLEGVANIAHLDLVLLHYAVLGGHVEMVATLEEWGIKPNMSLPRNSLIGYSNYLIHAHDFGSALEIAAFAGHLGMMRFLLARRPNVDQRGKRESRFPIEWAARRGNQAVVEMLLEHGADPGPALIGASQTGQTHVMRYLLDRFSDLINRDYEKPHPVLGGLLPGQRALNHATWACNLEAMTMLVEAGACPSHGDLPPEGAQNIPGGQKPIEFARYTGKQWVLEHLVSLDTKPDLQNAHVELPGESRQWCINGIIPLEHTWQWMKKY
jgi:ankyrin repeat protein